MLKLSFIFLFILVTGCTTGEKFRNIDIGMKRERVNKLVGKPDQIDRTNGYIITYYKNRLISGWSWDKADYYILFDKNDKVYKYGFGNIDRSLTRAMSNSTVSSFNTGYQIGNALGGGQQRSPSGEEPCWGKNDCPDGQRCWKKVNSYGNQESEGICVDTYQLSR